MKHFTSLSEVTQADRGASAAIGNFDGVHLGHQAVLDIARKAAREKDGKLAVLTFEPHPREVFHPEIQPFRLMTPKARAHRLEKIGVDLLFELPFTPALYELEHEEFSAQILSQGLGLSHVTVGGDFRYGKGRKGDIDTLRAAGEREGFGVTIADLIGTGAHSKSISSTAIREALSEGRVGDAATMLGHWHRIEGVVQHGAKRGREFGYPTTNMAITTLHPPRFGVYAVLVDVLSGPHKGSYTGAASLGVRPMFGKNTPNLETFIFDFSGDLYGAELSVALIEFLRPEENFTDIETLIAQIDKDCVDARAILASLP